LRPLETRGPAAGPNDEAGQAKTVSEEIPAPIGRLPPPSQSDPPRAGRHCGTPGRSSPTGDRISAAGTMGRLETASLGRSYNSPFRYSMVNRRSPKYLLGSSSTRACRSTSSM